MADSRSAALLITASAVDQGLVVVGGEAGIETDDDLRTGPRDRLVVVDDTDGELRADQGLIVVRVDAHGDSPCRFCSLLIGPAFGALRQERRTGAVPLS